MLQITVTNRKTGEKKDYKFAQNAILIGRQHNCDIILDATAVSRRHAKISVNKNLVELEDMGSGNGTLINQKKMPSKELTPISSNDIIRIEEFDITFNSSVSTVTAEPSITKVSRVDIVNPDMIEIKMIKKVLGAMDQDKLPTLIMVSEEFKNTKAVFEDGVDELTIGRDPACGLHLNSPALSRRHAVIGIKWGNFVITDLDSKNGTFVNGEKIKEKNLKDGDEVVFGTIKAIFKNPQEFDIDVLSQTLEEEAQKKKKLEDTASQIAKVKDDKQNDAKAKTDKENTISDAAMISAGKLQPQSETKKTDDKKTGGAVDNQENQSKEKTVTPATTDQKQEPPKTAASKKTGLFAALNPTEIILFGFGTLVIVIVLVVMAVILI